MTSKNSPPILPAIESNALSINALVRGDVQVAMIDEEPVLGLIDAKEVKVLLTFSEVTEYPGAVTIKELGYPELADKFTNLRFVVAPPGLETEPKNILTEALKRIQADPDFGAWAKKFKFRLLNVYGDDAQTKLTKFIKFYEDLAPTLKKYRSYQPCPYVPSTLLRDSDLLDSKGIKWRKAGQME